MGRPTRYPCCITVKRHDVSYSPGVDDAYRDKPRDASSDVAVKTIWASIFPQRGSEATDFHGRQSLMRCTIKTNYIDGQGIDAAMYFQYGARLFDIQTVLPDDETRKDVTFVCEEKATGI